MDNKNWTKHKKQCTQYLIESPVCILAGPTPSDLDEILTQVYLQITDTVNRCIHVNCIVVYRYNN